MSAFVLLGKLFCHIETLVPRRGFSTNVVPVVLKRQLKCCDNHIQNSVDSVASGLFNLGKNSKKLTLPNIGESFDISS